MKLALLVLLASVVATAQSVNWNVWSWTAPDPPLPNTQYVDYGWDSTSNYMIITATAPQRIRRAVPPAPMPPPVVRRTK